MSRLINPDIQFFDKVTGLPLALGKVYFGEPNQDPETNPKSVYSDSDLSVAISAAQTLTSAGKPSQDIFLDGSYSIKVVSALGVTQFTEDSYNGDNLIESRYVIPVSSRTAMKAYDVPPGTQFSLEEGGRSGRFVVKSGTPPSDPKEGLYVVLANGNYAERIGYQYLTLEMFGAGETSDDTAAFNGVKAVAPKGSVIYCPGASYTVSSFDFDADLFFVGKGRRGTKITVTGFATDADTSEKYGIRLIGTVADGLTASPKMWGFEIENTTAEPGVNGLLVQRKSILEDVYQHGATQDGIHFNTDAANNAAFFSRFTDVWAKDNGRMGCNLQRGANSNVFINCQFDSNGQDGFYQSTNGISTNGNIIIGGQASFNGSRGYNFDSGTNATLKGSYAEFNGQNLTAPAWAGATSYTAGDLVTSPASGLTNAQTEVVYQAASSHTSGGDFESDYDSGLWEPFGTELRVSNNITYSDIALGLALSNKTHRIRNESAQITTKVSLGGLYIKKEDNTFPVVQTLKFRDGVVFGQGVPSVTNYMDVSAGGNARTTYREAGAEIFAVEYDGSPANPLNELKFVPIDGGVEGAPPIRMRNNGHLGFFNTTPVAQQALSGAATDAATTQALANEIRTALINLGLAS